jgi:hypothetical protein
MGQGIDSRQSYVGGDIRDDAVRDIWNFQNEAIPHNQHSTLMPLRE